MGGHNHDSESDRWTKIGAVGELVSGYCGDTYWLATIFDVVTGMKGESLPISWGALGFGLAAAALSATGSTYCHYVLNTSHQSTHSKPSAINASSEEIPGDEATLPRQLNGEATPLFDTDKIKFKDLKVYQKLALLGDLVSHTGEVAAPITFVITLATRNALPRWGNALVLAGATLFGAGSSIANVRTCKVNMIEQAETRLTRSPG